MGSCLLLSFLLFSMRYVRYLVAIWWIVFMVLFISDVEICRFLRRSMRHVCIALLTPMMIVTRGWTFHPCALKVPINELCLSSFVCMAWSRNMPCVKVNAMIWIIRSNVGIRGHFVHMLLHVCMIWYWVLALQGNHTGCCCMCTLVATMEWCCLGVCYFGCQR